MGSEVLVVLVAILVEDLTVRVVRRHQFVHVLESQQKTFAWCGVR